MGNITPADGSRTFRDGRFTSTAWAEGGPGRPREDDVAAGTRRRLRLGRSAHGPGGAPGGSRRSDPIRFGLTAVDRIASSSLLDRLGVRRRAERSVQTLTRTGFATLIAASRTVKNARPARPGPRKPGGLFDVTPTDEQRMVVEVVREFAAEQVRPAAAAADAERETPEKVLATAADLGLSQLGVPAEAGGLATERTAVSNVLVAEALAHGDMGIAVACLAPAAVSGALSLWGSAEQQAAYLPAFTGDRVPPAALAIAEPRPAFDPLALRTTAEPLPGGDYRLTGVKALVPLAARAELFVVAAELAGHGPALFVVEPGASGVRVEAEPAMGLRAAATRRLVLDGAVVPGLALMPGASTGADGQDAPAADPYRDCVRLSRLAWCALAVGTAQAVLDHVVPYVQTREAFGEPIARRQAVAFAVADIATELDGMRLVTYRAAGRVDQGLDPVREIAAARRLCAEHGMRIGSQGVQLLGGHGYVKEHPVERWYRDLRAVGVMEGAVLA